MGGSLRLRGWIATWGAILPSLYTEVATAQYDDNDDDDDDDDGDNDDDDDDDDDNDDKLSEVTLKCSNSTLKNNGFADVDDFWAGNERLKLFFLYC